MWLLLVLAALLAGCALSVVIGTRDVGWTEIASALGGGRDSIGEAVVAVRLPRTLLAALAG
ncbi:iron ABC transporter permease, partial [Cereibacter changlensis]